MRPRQSRFSTDRRWGLWAGAFVIPLLVLVCSGEPTASVPNGNSPKTRVVVQPSILEIEAGKTGVLVANVFDSSGRMVTNPAVTWVSADGAVATASPGGVVSARSVGTVILTATSGGLSATAEVRVTPTAESVTGITVYPRLTYQKMLGWEGTAFIGQIECNRMAFQNYRLTLLRQLVHEMGINRVRLQVRSGHENPQDHYARVVQTNNLADWNPHRYESVNDNDDPMVANPAGFQFTELSYTTDSVIQPMRSELQQRGERLYVTLTYVDFGPSPWEQSSNPEEYAELILQAFRHLQARYGWVPDAVEVILEPDNTPNWTPAVIGRAAVAAGDRLKAAGFRPHFIVPGTTNMSRAVEFFDQMLSVPRVLEYVTDISYHRYSGVSDAALSALGSRANQYGVRTAMLEKIGADQNDLHKDIRDGRVSAWQQFGLGGCVNPQDDGGKYYVINTANPQAPVITLGSRSRYLRQYFVFVRDGAVRIGAASADSRFDPLAFRNSDGKLILVTKTSGGGSVQVLGLPPGTYGLTYTTSSQSFASLPDAVVSQGGALQLQMPAAGVVTVHQR